MKNQLSGYCKVLLLTEFVLAFSAPVLVLVLGLTFGVFFSFALILKGELSAMLMLATSIGGLYGMIGVSRLLLAVLESDSVSVNLTTFWYVLSGCIAVIPLTLIFIQQKGWYWWGAGLAPHVVAVQLIWLNRSAIFLRSK